MKDPIFIFDSVHESLENAAKEAQAVFEQENGEHYDLEELKKVFVSWLEISIEELASEALYHVFDKGNRSMNSRYFHDKLKKLTPAYDPQEADERAAA